MWMHSTISHKINLRCLIKHERNFFDASLICLTACMHHQDGYFGFSDFSVSISWSLRVFQGVINIKSTINYKIWYIFPYPPDHFMSLLIFCSLNTRWRSQSAAAAENNSDKVSKKGGLNINISLFSVSQKFIYCVNTQKNIRFYCSYFNKCLKNDHIS